MSLTLRGTRFREAVSCQMLHEDTRRYQVWPCRCISIIRGGQNKDFPSLLGFSVVISYWRCQSCIHMRAYPACRILQDFHFPMLGLKPIPEGVFSSVAELSVSPVWHETWVLILQCNGTWKRWRIYRLTPEEPGNTSDTLSPNICSYQVAHRAAFMVEDTLDQTVTLGRCGNMKLHPVSISPAARGCTAGCDKASSPAGIEYS